MKPLMTTTKEVLCTINEAMTKKMRFALLIIFYFSYYILLLLQPLFTLRYLGYFALLVFGLTTALVANREMKTGIEGIPKNRKRIAFVLFFLGLWMIVTGFFTRSRGQVFQGAFFGIFVPASWLVTTNRESKKELIRASGLASVGALLFLLVISVCFVPIYPGQYSSILLNPNGLAQALIPMVISTGCLVAENLVQPKKTLWGRIGMSVLTIVLFGVSISFMIFTKSRTGLLSLLVVVALCFLYAHFKTRGSLWKTTVFVVLAFLMLSPTLFMLKDVGYGLLKWELRTKGSAQRLIGDEIETYTASADEQIQDIDLSLQTQSFMDRIGKGITDEADTSSGRFAIWNVAIKKISFFGRPQYSTFAVTYSNRVHITNNTHNILLQMGYYYGIPGMVLMTLFLILYAWEILRYCVQVVMNGKLDGYTLYLVSTAATFFVVANISGTYELNSTFHSLLFWQLASFPHGLFSEKPKECLNQSKETLSLHDEEKKILVSVEKNNV